MTGAKLTQKDGEWDLIVMDPPWNERGGGKIKRGADRHYGLLKTEVMPSVIRGSGVFTPADNCHLYMWVTKNHLLDGLWLMKELGFEYKTTVTWVKTRQDTSHNRDLLSIDLGMNPLHECVGRSVANGLGQYFRGSTELILFGVRGRGFAIRSEARNLPDVIFAPLGQHSAKPAAARELFEARTKAPDWETRRLEMFARTTSPGWTSWGLDVDRTADQ